MVQNSLPNNEKYKLESQIREAYGRVVYSQTCQDKKLQRLLKIEKWLRIIQISLSAITTGYFLSVLIGFDKIAEIVGALSSLALLILSTCSKEFNLVVSSQQHRQAADLLWKIREEYVSLLIDFDSLSEEEIRNKRDELNKRTSEVYSNYPRTDYRSYKEAQKALKTEEEQTFSEHEIDVMLPNSIRRTDVTKKK